MFTLKPSEAKMFGFILCIIRISLLPLSSTKKNLWQGYCYCKKKIGRPKMPYDIKQLVLNMKNYNICWGNGKIQGELEKLGVRLDKRTISGIIEDFRRKGKVKKGLTQVLVYTESFIKSLWNGFFYT
ncbi:hypothetical protein ES708_24161 [subsurface metagenome]